jgi:hypothetical protein
MAGHDTALTADLVQRLHQALMAGHDQLFKLILDPSEQVLRNLLKNPALADEHLLVMLKRRDLSEGLLQSIHDHDRCRSSHRMKLALAQNPQTPTTLVLALLPHLYLFELLNLCSLAGTTPDQRLAAERQIIQRLPTVELGNKLSLARRAGGAILDALMAEGQPQVIEAALGNPRIKEVSILKFLRGGKTTPESISQIARHPQWSQRRNLRIAILKQRRTPMIWYTLWLPGLRTFEIKGLLTGKTLGTEQRRMVEEALRNRTRG